MWQIILSAMLFHSPADTTVNKSYNMDEVVVTASRGDGRKRSVKGQAASIDEHLATLSHVNLVRRGAYAWEPVVNNMSDERLSTTIDGMKIFYACTDKMDPVTSYVESGNLQSISLNSGLDGNPQATGNIGGSLDLKLRRVGFDKEPFRLNLSAGHEFNGHLQVYGADAALSGKRLYANFGAFFRKARNYTTGNGESLPFSQFQKMNVFANLGARIASNDIVEATVIYDRATDVGYPALNMDVAKVEGFITSLSHTHNFRNPLLSSWQTKIYYNHITHVMDDTKRPDVEIHMDMPGKSWTSGLYSILRVGNDMHDASVNYDIYYNRRFADMTMYPGGAAPMYMVTWPDVGTLNTGLALTDNINMGNYHSLRLSAKMAWQTQKLNNDEGYKALAVFFPGMKQDYNQTVGRVAASWTWSPDGWRISAGAGWGSRAPTVTEAYGYYLNNTFDQYDYIGNPHLKNESAVELNAVVEWMAYSERKDAGRKGKALKIGVDANAFLFSNYIIGLFENRLSPMTVDAEGVKVYGNLPSAKIVNTSAYFEWNALTWLSFDGRLSYAIGKDNDGDNLPFISPLSYTAGATFTYRQWHAQVALKGNARQSQYGEKYGETGTPAFTIANVSVSRTFTLPAADITLRIGVENLLDKYYTTYSDWNKIPQKGRNIYANVDVSL